MMQQVSIETHYYCSCQIDKPSARRSSLVKMKPTSLFLAFTLLLALIVGQSSCATLHLSTIINAHNTVTEMSPAAWKKKFCRNLCNQDPSKGGTFCNCDEVCSSDAAIMIFYNLFFLLATIL